MQERVMEPKAAAYSLVKSSCFVYSVKCYAMKAYGERNIYNNNNNNSVPCFQTNNNNNNNSNNNNNNSVPCFQTNNNNNNNAS
jgi:hypothetical protein